MRKKIGYGTLGIILIIGVIAVIGIVAWRGYDARTADETHSTTRQQAEDADKKDPLPSVTTTSDLNAAEKAVQDVDPDSLSTSVIDESLN